MPSKLQAACFLIYLKHSDVVASLIATVEKLAGGVEIEAAGIIPSRPFVRNERKITV